MKPNTCQLVTKPLSCYTEILSCIFKYCYVCDDVQYVCSLLLYNALLETDIFTTEYKEQQKKNNYTTENSMQK